MLKRKFINEIGLRDGTISGFETVVFSILLQLAEIKFGRTADEDFYFFGSQHLQEKFNGLPFKYKYRAMEQL